MAFGLKSVSVSFLLVMCLILVLQLSEDSFNVAEKTTYHGISRKENSNRKLLVVESFEAKEEVFKINEKNKEEGYEVVWELRAAPLGPDPRHHHGADPKKPRTP